MPPVHVTLVDINPRMVAAWRETFEGNPEVRIVQGSMLEQRVAAWVSPTNARGKMDGGLDAVVKSHFGPGIEQRLQSLIAQRYGGLLPLGHAVCVPTDRPMPRFVVSTPTMVASSEDVSDTLNVALACAAAFQAVHLQSAYQPGSIDSVAVPGLGANTGKVPPEICADLMWTAYNLFRSTSHPDFVSMRAGLEDVLGDLAPMSGSSGAAKKPEPAAPPPVPGAAPPGGPSAAKPPPLPKKGDQDFDDFG
jgi:O-acetyl-ADP-ribose deacetylase (regulator of RNase III)